MKIIDILNKMYKKEAGKFSFVVEDGSYIWTCGDKSYIWTYEDGRVYQNEGIDDFLYCVSQTYALDTNIIEIKDYIEIDRLPLEYIQNNTPGKLTYKGQTVNSTQGTDLLAAVINKIILEIEEIKKGK